MSNNFKAFEGGFRIYPTLTSDPVTGKVGEIYYNASSTKLRLCIDDSPVTWADLLIAPGTVEGATLRWNNTSGEWEENTDLRITANTIFTPDGATGTLMQLTSGASSGAGNDGGDIRLTTGAGGAGAFQGKVLINARGIYSPDGTTGSDLSISGGEGTVNEGGSVNIAGGAGATRQGDIVLSAYKVGFQAAAATDPASVLTVGDLYRNTTFGRLKKYEASGWHFIEKGKGVTSVAVVDVKDDTETTLPATTATLLDTGYTVVDGTLALFTNLSSGANEIYLAAVSGIAITWTQVALGQRPDGLPDDGDYLFVKSGTSNGLKTFQYLTSSWVAFLGTVIQSANQDRSMYIAKGGTKIWDEIATSLTWTEDAFVHIAGLLETRNKIAAGSVTLAADGDVAYVSVNRSGAAPATLTVLTSSISALASVDPTGNSFVIFARRIGDDIVWGTGDQEKNEETQIVSEFTLVDNSMGIIFLKPYADVDSFVISYSVERDGGKETGTLFLTTDGSDASVSGVSSEIGENGIQFYADISGPNVRLRYSATSTGFNATLRYTVKKWLAF